METQIIRLDPANAAILARVAVDVFDGPIDTDLLAAYLAEPGHLMVLAVADGSVVGQARGMVQRHPDHGPALYIDNLGVTPTLRRRGIATRLLDELTAWGRERGCEDAWVATEADNDAARATYSRRGADATSVVMFDLDL